MLSPVWISVLFSNKTFTPAQTCFSAAHFAVEAHAHTVSSFTRTFYSSARISRRHGVCHAGPRDATPPDLHAGTQRGARAAWLYGAARRLRLPRLRHHPRRPGALEESERDCVRVQQDARLRGVQLEWLAQAVPAAALPTRLEWSGAACYEHSLHSDCTSGASSA